jgi:1-acyl-sn-glycerol-3-phosphate acyltransferase
LPAENSSLPEDPRDRIRYVFHTTLFRRVAVVLFRALMWLVMDFKASGAEHIPTEGPVVQAPNHLTNFDVFPIQLSISRPIFAMAKSELHENLILDMALRQLGSFPVYRGEKDQWAIRHAQKVLEHRQILGMFPEGTRSKGRGLRAGKTGAARLALWANCPIIPLAIDGTHKMFERFPRRTPVTIRIGEPIYPQPKETALALTDRLMFTLADMLPNELRGVYAARPKGFED